MDIETFLQNRLISPNFFGNNNRTLVVRISSLNQLSIPVASPLDFVVQQENDQLFQVLFEFATACIKQMRFFRDLPISVAYENSEENLQIMGNFDFLAICDSTLSETIFYCGDLWISNLLDEIEIERYNFCSLVIVK